MNAVIAGACDRIESLGGHGRRRARRLRRPRGGARGADRASSARAHSHEAGTWIGTSRWAPLATPEGRRACRDASPRSASTALLVIGGHGSAQGARALAGALPVAFVPATIDHDIEGTEATIGMDSAIGYALDAIDRLRVTGRSLPGRAFLVQTLGAPNGYLADAVAAAAGIDEVLVPERPYDLDELGRRLRDKAAAGAAIAVMSEAVGDAVEHRGRARASVPGSGSTRRILGHAQRAATPSPRDRAVGDAAGRAAVDALAAAARSFIDGDRRRRRHARPTDLAHSVPPPRSKPMTPGYEKPLYILAFDHRTSFERKLYGIEGTPTPDDRLRLAEGKQIILDGLLAAAGDAPPARSAR